MARKKAGEGGEERGEGGDGDGETGGGDGAQFEGADAEAAITETPTDPGAPLDELTDGAGISPFDGPDGGGEPTRPGAFISPIDVDGATPTPVDPSGDATGPLEVPVMETAPGAAPEGSFEMMADGGQVLDFARAREEADEAAARGDTGQAGLGQDGDLAPVPFEQLEALIEALLFASDKPLNPGDLKRLTGERDGRLINQAVETLIARRKDAGIMIVTVAGAYSLRTNPTFADWVSKLVAGKPVRLSRAMLETLAIVAYRQPITRPEIDDVRGVDCGPVLKTLLDRNLVRIIGKSEEVGRPMLYGTTSEFLRIFSLKDLTQLPTLRQFHELSAEHQAKVEEAHPAPETGASSPTTTGETASPFIGLAAPVEPLATAGTAPDPGEDDQLMAELETASEAASRAAGPLTSETPPGDAQDH